MVESDTDRSNTPCSTFDINGIDASCGEYLSGELTAAEVAAAARGEMGVGGVGGDDREALGERHRRDTEKRLGPIAGTRPNDLASAGWGVIFASDLDPAVVEALATPHRLPRRQAEGGFSDSPGLRDIGSVMGRNPCGPSCVETESAAVDAGRPPAGALLPDGRRQPGRRPFPIPVRTGCRLRRRPALVRESRWHARPRRVRALRAAVVESESVPGPWRPSRRAVFVGVANRGDRATSLGLGDLVRPLGAALAATEEVRDAGWDVQTFGPELARKDDLAGLLNGPEPPALLFTASHGMAFPNGHALQYAHQGALLCQDWPGSGGGAGPSLRDIISPPMTSPTVPDSRG